VKGRIFETLDIFYVFFIKIDNLFECKLVVAIRIADQSVDVDLDFLHHILVFLGLLF